MISHRLVTLGTLELLDGDGSRVAHRKRRLALLALVASAGTRGVSRDQLLAYLWPEGSADAGRHSLEQLLYALRRAMDESVFVGTNPLRLDPAIVTSDIADFEEALGRGDLVGAVALYRGPFLDGFYLGAPGEFDRWAESERARLARRHRDALGRLAAIADASGDRLASVHWWRRLAVADPFSSQTVLGAMRALVAAGDTVGALQQAREFGAFVRRELESPPDPAVTAFVDSLRREPTSGRGRAPPAESARAATSMTAPPEMAIDAASHDGTAPAEAETAPAATPMPLAGAPPLRRSGWRWPALIAVLLSAGLGVARLAAPDRTPANRPADPSRAAVVLWESAGDARRDSLSRAMAELMPAALAGDGGLLVLDSRPTDPESFWRGADVGAGARLDEARRRARALGAGQVIVGTVAATPDGRLTTNAWLASVGDGSVRQTIPVEGSRDSLPQLAERLATALLVEHARLRDGRPPSALSSSPVALRDYIAAVAQRRRGATEQALRSLDDALDHDSAFALAGLEYGLARGWVLRYETDPGAFAPLSLDAATIHNAGEAERWRAALDVAWRHRDALGPADLALLTAVRGPRFPQPLDARAALEAWERAVESAPQRPEAHYNLGVLLLYQGLALGLEHSRARAAAAFRTALELDSGFVAPLRGLIEIAALDGDRGALRGLGTRYLASGSNDPLADYVRWRVAVGLRDDVALRSIRTRLESLSLESLERIEWASQVSGVALEDAERASREILRRASGQRARRVAVFNAQLLALNRGRPGDALLLLENTKELASATPGIWWERRIEGALFGDGDTAAAERSVRDALAAVRAGPSPAGKAERALRARARFQVALWQLERGDTAGVGEVIALLRASGRDDPGYPRLVILLASWAVATRDSSAPHALARLDSIASLGCCVPKWTGLLDARLHERRGDLAGALRLVRAGRWIYAPAYWATALREEGRLAQRTGDRDGAARAFRAYLALRADPEPRMRADAERVRAELARLGADATLAGVAPDD